MSDCQPRKAIALATATTRGKRENDCQSSEVVSSMIVFDIRKETEEESQAKK